MGSLESLVHIVYADISRDKPPNVAMRDNFSSVLSGWLVYLKYQEFTLLSSFQYFSTILDLFQTEYRDTLIHQNLTCVCSCESNAMNMIMT